MKDTRLQIFISAAERQSFTKAAMEHSLSQAAVSKNITTLESELQVQLFERHGQTIKLTPAGEKFLLLAREINEAYQRATFEMSQLTEIQHGSIRIGASTTIAQYVLPAILAQHHLRYPNVELTMFNGNSQDVLRMLENHQIDVGLIESDEMNPQFHYTKLVDDELVLVVGSQNKYYNAEEINLNALKQMPLVLREQGSGTLNVILRELEKYNIRLQDLNVTMHLGSSESIKRFVEKSDAGAIISIRAVSRELYDGKLKLIEMEDLELPRAFHIVTLQGGLPTMVQQFIDFTLRRKSSI